MKKKIPLSILENLQPIVDNNLAVIKPIKDEKILFHMIDSDIQSDFYFKVVKQENRSGGIHYLIEYKPKHRDILSGHGDWLLLEGVTKAAKLWVETIISFNKMRTVYDDPILQSYENSFAEQLEILDEDADFAPFSLKQQLYLDQYLISVDQKLEVLKNNKNHVEVAELSELQEEAKNIKFNITKSSKREIIRRLARFWAKTQKVGLDILREIVIDLSSEIIKKLLEK